MARSLAALAVLRARLPCAAAALAAALPRPSERVRRPLAQILQVHTASPPTTDKCCFSIFELNFMLFFVGQLAALLQCRNHELIDVETALEADEGEAPERVGRRRLVPVAAAARRRAPAPARPPGIIKEVPLTVFHQGECQSARGFPCLDPLRLRTE